MILDKKYSNFYYGIKSLKPRLIFFFLSILFVYACIDPIEVTFEDFESALVIEATITTEMKQQEVFLTRTFEFEDDGPLPESNALITVTDNTGNVFNFQDIGEGIYQSTEAFSAITGRTYELSITTQDGRNYGSDNVTATAITPIGEITAERITNDLGEDGMAILVDSFDPSGNSINYRYEYEETFMIIAPDWNPMSLIRDPSFGNECNVILTPNITDERVCYGTDESNTIILTSTEGFEEDRVTNFMVRFINRNNFIISHRYSILVKQFVQSNEAFTFFQTLEELSSSESLFSETQPGFLQGNVFSRDNDAERVLGFFDVSAMSSERLFFNYEDFYPNEPLPPFIVDCDPSAPVIANLGGCVLLPILDSGAGVFAGENQDIMQGEGPFLIVSRACGDCSVLGSAEVPEFWIE